jgi:hypothetical protein
MHIKNTLCVQELEVSEPCLQLPRGPVPFDVLGAARPLTFDAAENLPPV